MSKAANTPRATMAVHAELWLHDVVFKIASPRV
jgi:hypothetical protein